MNQQQSEIPTAVEISSDALERMRTYEQIVTKNGKLRLECYGYLLNANATPSLVCHDVLLSQGQVVSSVHADVAAKTAGAKTLQELAQSAYSPIGCWHSHHDMDAWHLSKDDENLVILGNALASNRAFETGGVKNTNAFPRCAYDGSFKLDHGNLSIVAKNTSGKPVLWGTNAPHNDALMHIPLEGYVASIGLGEHPVAPLFRKEERLCEFLFPTMTLSITSPEPFTDITIASGLQTDPDMLSMSAANDTYLFPRKLRGPTGMTSVVYSVVISREQLYAKQCIGFADYATNQMTFRYEEVPVRIVPPAVPRTWTKTDLEKEVKERVRTSYG